MSADITFRGTEEFMQKLKQIADEYPKVAERHLRAVGNKLKKRAEENTPVGKTKKTKLKKNRRTGEVKEVKNTTKLSQSYTAKVIGFRGHSLEYQLRSRSRRFHLVERGHVQKTPGGRVTGFTQGRFFFKRTVDEFTSGGEIKRQMEKFMREIQRKAGG